MSAKSVTNALTTAILRFLLDEGVYAWRNNTTGIYDPSRGHFRTASKKGVSDIIAIDRGHFIGIEIKTGKDRLSDEQKGFKENVEHAGGTIFVVHTFDDFLVSWDEYVLRNGIDKVRKRV